MARGPATFRQRDVTAVVKAVIAGGCQISHVEIDKDGKIVVRCGKTQNENSTKNEWDTP